MVVVDLNRRLIERNMAEMTPVVQPEKKVKLSRRQMMVL